MASITSAPTAIDDGSAALLRVSVPKTAPGAVIVRDPSGLSPRTVVSPGGFTILTPGGTVTAECPSGAVNVTVTATRDPARATALGIGDTARYGVVGDNATATDGAVVQAAFDDLVSKGVTCIRVVGLYGPKLKITGAPLLLDSGIHYDFRGTTITAATGANLDALAMSRAAYSQTAATFDTGIVVEGGTWDGNRSLQTGGLGHGIVLAAGRSRISGVLVKNTRGDGVVLTDVNAAGTALANTVPGVENRIDKCIVENTGGSGYRVWQSGTVTLTDGYLTECIAAFNRHYGIRCDSTGGWHITNNHTYGSGLTGIVARYGYASYVTHNYIEGIGVLSAAGNSTGTAIDTACPAYDPGTTYSYNQVIVAGGNTLMVSKVDGNVGNTPNTSAEDDFWRPTLLGAKNVAGIAVVDLNTGRATYVVDNHISLGHNTFGLHASMDYRGILAAGPASGSSKGSLVLARNDVLNELQPSGSNTTAIRIATTIATGTGGVNLLQDVDNRCRGQWSTVRSVASASAPTIAVGAGLGSGGSPAATITAGGTDGAGSGQLTAGTSSLAAGLLATVTFSGSAHTIAPTVAFSPGGASSAALGLFAVATTSGFGIYSMNVPASGASYSFSFTVFRQG